MGRTRALPARVVVSIARHEAGAPRYLIGQVQDITAQKEHEKRSRFQLALLTALAESCLNGVLAVSNSGQIPATNEQFRQLWGIPEEQLAQARTIEALRPSAL